MTTFCQQMTCLSVLNSPILESSNQLLMSLDESFDGGLFFN